MNNRFSKRPVIQTNQKALSSSSFETNSTAVSSSLSTSCIDSCGSNFCRTPHTTARMRRGAIVFHPYVPKHMPVNYSSSCNSKKFKRRFATCCSYPETIEAVRKVATLVQKVHSQSSRGDTLPPKNAVVFDHDGHLLPDYETNNNCLEKWFLYYYEIHRLSPSKTHRAIVANSFLEELKSDNLTFYQRKESPQGVERYVKLDDETVSHRFRKELGRIHLD